MAKHMNHEEFVSRLNEVQPSLVAISTYQNCRTKVLVKCSTCGFQWGARSSDLLRGHGCPRCGGKEKKSTDRFRYEVSEVNPNIEVVGEYINTATKIETRCLICGHYWKANPSTLLSGNGCPLCGGTIKKTQKEFLETLSMRNPDIMVLGEYKNNRTKINVKCTRCGYEWSATPHNLIDARSRCPKCTHSSTSFVEQFILEWLKSVLGEGSVVHRDISTINMELDVYVPKLKLAFEPGSWHWHKDKLENDAIKRKRCLENGIRLITIYDKVPEKEMFSANDVILYPYDIRVKKKSNQIEELLLTVLQEQGYDIDGYNINLDEVVNAAYKNSVKTDTKEFINKLEQKRIDVEVQGTYKSSSSRIRVRCKKCGYIWSPQADTLLSGNSSCRKCGIVKNGKAHLKSQEKFVSEVEEKNPSVEVLGEYIKASERIRVRCRVCGKEWNPVANTLVRKNPSSCPECGKEKMIKTRIANKKESLGL